MITYNLRTPVETDANICIGVTGENNSYTAKFLIKELTDESLTFSIHLRFSDGSVNTVIPDEVSVDDDGTSVIWKVKKNDIFVHGLFDLQIEGRNGDDYIFQTEIVKIYADESICIEDKEYDNPNSETLRLRKEAYDFLCELKLQQEQLDENMKLLLATDITKKADISDTLAGYGITDAYTKGEIDKSYKSTRNLNTSAMESGTLNSTTGKPGASSTKIRTADFIAVEPATNYTLSVTVTGYITSIYGYTADGEFIKIIKSLSDSMQSVSFTTPENCTQIKWITATADINTTEYQLELGSMATDYVPSKVVAVHDYNLDEELSKKLEQIDGKADISSVYNKVTRNLFNSEMELGYLNTNTGATASSQSRIRTADFISVLPETQYTLTAFSADTLERKAGYGYAILMYDADGSFLNVVHNMSSSYSSTTFTTPENCYKIKMYAQTISDTKALVFQIESGSTSTEYVPNRAIAVHEYNLDKSVVEKLNSVGEVTHHLYVSKSYTESDDGFGVTKFNTIYDANESITDNSESNRYIIHVAEGTYTDLQERYSGVLDSQLASTVLNGVICKNYVYYEGNVKNPQKCVISWDGATGIDADNLVYNNVVKKCPFHLVKMSNNMHTKISGFTLDCKNIRYGLHIDSSSAGYMCDWSVEDCVIKWGGTPDCSDNSRYKPAIGCGHSPFETGRFSRVRIVNADTVSGSTIAYFGHDNTNGSGVNESGSAEGNILVGAKITFENCDFANMTVECRSGNGKVCDINNKLNLVDCINIGTVNNIATSGGDGNTYWDITR